MGAGSRGGTLYGPGIYAAECSSKADEYATEVQDYDRLGLPADFQGKLHAMLVCRATLGKIHYDDARQPSVTTSTKVPHHSILGDRWRAVGTYRECILSDNNQIYPNFIVYYERLDLPTE